MELKSPLTGVSFFFFCCSIIWCGAFCAAIVNCLPHLSLCFRYGVNGSIRIVRDEEEEAEDADVDTGTVSTRGLPPRSAYKYDEKVFFFSASSLCSSVSTLQMHSCPPSLLFLFLVLC